MTKAFFIGSGNVFADIGLPDAEEHLLKASLPGASSQQSDETRRVDA